MKREQIIEKQLEKDYPDDGPEFVGNMYDIYEKGFTAGENFEKKKSFLDGYLTCIQFIVIGMGEDSIAECAIMESGYSKSEYLKSQRESGYENKKMNKVIREAFRRKNL